jgi:hypothetical protein
MRAAAFDRHISVVSSSSYGPAANQAPKGRGTPATTTAVGLDGFWVMREQLPEAPWLPAEDYTREEIGTRLMRAS